MPEQSFRNHITVVLGDESFEFDTTVRDHFEMKKLVEKDDDMDWLTIKVAYVACKRLGHFDGSLDEFLDQARDIRLTFGSELPPLGPAPSN